MLYVFKPRLVTAATVTALLFSGSAPLLAIWSTAMPISEAPSIINPTPSNLAIDANSNAITGWLQGELGTDNTLYTSSLPAGASRWNLDVLLYEGTAPQFATFPLLFANKNGVIRAAWANFHQSDTNYDETSLATAAQTALGYYWPAPVASDTLTGFPNGGSVGPDESGNCVVVLATVADSNTNGPPFSINYFAFNADTNSWSGPVNLDTDNSYASPAVFAASAKGNAVFAWRADSILKTARYNFATNTVTPIDEIPLPSGTTNVGFIQGAMGDNGDVVAVFSVQIAYENNFALYASFLPKESDIWTFPIPVSDPANNSNGMLLSVKTDKNSDSTLVWGEVTPDNTLYIRAATLPFGEDLSEVSNLTSPSPTTPTTVSDSSNIILDIDAWGNAVAVWQFLVDEEPTVQVASSLKGGSWSTALTLSSTGFMPRVVLSDQGTAVAVWLDTETSYLKGAKNNRLFPVMRPSSFGGYIVETGDDYDLHLHWSPSRAPNIVNYQIFKDGELLANVAGDGPYTYVHTLGCDSLEDAAYTLVAVASNGNKSTPLPLVLAN
jgi:hypothetical protein